MTSRLLRDNCEAACALCHQGEDVVTEVAVESLETCRDVERTESQSNSTSEAPNSEDRGASAKVRSIPDVARHRLPWSRKERASSDMNALAESQSRIEDGLLQLFAQQTLTQNAVSDLSNFLRDRERRNSVRAPRRSSVVEPRRGPGSILRSERRRSNIEQRKSAVKQRARVKSPVESEEMLPCELDNTPGDFYQSGQTLNMGGTTSTESPLAASDEGTPEPQSDNIARKERGLPRRTSNDGRETCDWGQDGKEPLTHVEHLPAFPLTHNLDGDDVADDDSIDSAHEIALDTLPAGWPRGLVPRAGSNVEKRVVASRNRTGYHMQVTLPSEEALGEQCRPSRVIIKPHSCLRLTLDFSAVLVLSLDLTIIPLALAFDLPTTGGFLLASTCFSCAFWTAEFAVNFFSAHDSDEAIELRLSHVVLHYLTTWFALDIAVVSIDWINIIAVFMLQFNASSSSRSFQLAKLLRFLRIVSILRLGRLALVFEETTHLYLTDGVRLLAKVFMLLLGTVWAGHILACAWYSLGNGVFSDTGARWTETMNLVNDDLRFEYADMDLLYQYTSALHFATAQITLGGADIFATNTAERIFNIFSLLFGLVFSTTLVSSISSWMVDLQMRTNDENEKMRKLQAYLKQNQVDSNITIRVNRQAQARISRKETLLEDDVVALDLLSNSLRTELRFAICKEYILSHCLFRLWMNLNLATLQELCNLAVTFTFLQPNDELFVPCQKCDRAFYVCRGDLAYSQTPTTSFVSRATSAPVSRGAWICEAAMFMNWFTVGTLEAMTSVQLFVVDCDAMVECQKKHRLIDGITAAYSRSFHVRTTRAGPPNSEWPSDLEVPFTAYCELVMAMSEDHQTVVGLDALKHVDLRSKLLAKSSAIEKLREEVLSSRSTLFLNAEGVAERVVAVLAFKIRRTDGRHLVQLAEVDDEGVVPSIKLPGGKCLKGELPGETARRLLAAKLLPIANLIHIQTYQRESVTEQSNKFLVKTTYLRTEVEAGFVGQIDSRYRLNMHFEYPSVEDESEALSIFRAGGRPSEGDIDMLAHVQDEGYVFTVADKTTIFVWLDPAELQRVNSVESERVTKWLAALSLKETQKAMDEPECF